MRLLWAFLAGWCECVLDIWWTLGGTPWHAVRVSTRKHWGMARFLWREREWAW